MRLAWCLVPVASALACAQVLSYDDYRAREPVVVPPDTGVELDTEPVVADTADVGLPPVHPPARPSGEARPSGAGKTLWLAIRRYELGTVDPTGVNDETAWAVHGYDLDSICTGRSESVANLGTCRRPEGAQQDSLMDGERCRDNNFGRHIGTILRSAAPDTEKMLYEQLGLGAQTWLLRIDDVDKSGDDAFAPATLYRVADERNSEVKVKWDGTDVRSIHSDTVIDNDISRGVTTFPKGYIANGTWVSGEPAKLDLLVPVTAALFVTMKLDSAQLTLELSDDRTTGTNGVVSGALARDDVEAVLKPIADNGGVCPGTPIYATMLSAIAKMPDVVMGAPNLQDTTLTCDGVSAGMGFTVVPVQPVTKRRPAAALPQPPLRRRGLVRQRRFGLDSRSESVPKGPMTAKGPIFCLFVRV